MSARGLGLLHAGRGDRAAATGTLAALAARCDLRELLVRAHLHQYHLGDRSALASAHLFAADIDNPSLSRLLADTSQ
jgi:hypothetical protein